MRSHSVALSHHWLIRRRGGEKVLDAFRELFPAADVFTLIHDPRYEWPTLPAPRVRASFLNGLPGASRHYPKLLPLMPMAARRIRIPPVDLVLCSDAALAKAMSVDPRTKLLCYCHSPMRYAWDLSDVYRATLPVLLRPLWGPMIARVREADRLAARRVDLFIANSRHVADRIRRAYGRESTLIHPPVDLPDSPTNGVREDFYLCVGHHVAYKQLDLAVEACRRLNRKLVVIGDGPEAARLRNVAGGNVKWLGWQPDDVVRQHYARARALIFPGEEDFGIVPVEAMAHGCPVIAYGVGGATETVAVGRTGLLFSDQDVGSLARAIEQADETSFDPAGMLDHCQQFSRPRFLRQMNEFTNRVMA